MAQLPNASYHGAKFPFNRFRVALMVIVYFGVCSCDVLSTKIPSGGSPPTPLPETLTSRGNNTGWAPSTVEHPGKIPEPQKHDDKKSSRVKNTSEFVSTSWWWSTCVLGPTAAICLVPFIWCYVLPKLGPAVWKVFICACTLVAVSYTHLTLPTKA